MHHEFAYLRYWTANSSEHEFNVDALLKTTTGMTMEDLRQNMKKLKSTRRQRALGASLDGVLSQFPSEEHVRCPHQTVLLQPLRQSCSTVFKISIIFLRTHGEGLGLPLLVLGFRYVFDIKTSGSLEAESRRGVDPRCDRLRSRNILVVCPIPYKSVVSVPRMRGGRQPHRYHSHARDTEETRAADNV